MQKLNIKEEVDLLNKYTSEIEVDILKEKRLAFQIRDLVFDVHVAGNKMNYSIYNVHNAQLLDDGKIDILDDDYWISDLVAYINPIELSKKIIDAKEIIFYNYNQFRKLLGF